ncbi:nucleoside triphosphate pyrophosphohydrolase [Rheinheimera sp.]|uniref:nucleoside triphosphate pyrophosphohydrolase n=1 Tax=Rheinheimera sp. TaxID=1869214 RepID=UPI00307E5B81
MTSKNHILSKNELFSLGEHNHIGEKACGFLLLEQVTDWIPEFYILKSSIYNNASGKSCDSLYESIHDSIKSTFNSHDSISKFIEKCNKIIVRSSAENETLEERGQYKSISSDPNINDISHTCAYIIFDSINNGNLNKISLIIQQEINGIACGHLSNERRVSEKSRDWLIDYEKILNDHKKENERFKIFKNRYEIDRIAIPSELIANSLKQVKEALHYPAILATIHYNGARVHYEWVWDGHKVWVVQADKDTVSKGVNPHSFIESEEKNNETDNLQTKIISNLKNFKIHKFKKLENQIIFNQAGLATTNLWILNGNIDFKNDYNARTTIYSDLEEIITKGPIVIRCDLSCVDNGQGKRQNLPRSDSIFSASDAMDFIDKCESILTALDPRIENHCFIIHNYIPSLSSAFVYATPDNPRVRVDSIWGLPDGLQYYSHDSYELNAKKNEIIREKKRHKEFMLGSSMDGKWCPARISEPYDWRASISPSNCKEIASHTLQLAKYLNKAVQVMWFVQTSEFSPHPKNIPWYFEERSIESFQTDNNESIYSKNTLIIKDSFDIENARKLFSTTSEHHSILLKPHESNIRCNRFLEEVSELSIEFNKPILFYGSILQHAFYQLRKFGAKVSCMEPFSPTVEKSEYKKLVRDKIPSIIENDGERPEYKKVDGDTLIELLEEKILEESQEVAGAANRQERINEIADLFEVISSLCRLEDIKLQEIKAAQKAKKRRIGGFDDGIYLLNSVTRSTISAEQDLSKPAVKKGKKSAKKVKAPPVKILTNTSLGQLELPLD